MDSSFGHNFSRIRVHADPLAAKSAEAVNARAFAVDNHVVFGPGEYEPGSERGRSLLAHELAHTLDRRSGILQRYTDAEQKEMAEGRVKGQASDVEMANKRGFQAGDIVFRLGSTALGFIMGEEVSHGGIYIGEGLIHDAVGFGNRNVRVTNFYNPALNEAADSSVFRTVRFIGPENDLIVDRLLRNIHARDFRMPTDPVPFNLFSSAGDYKTATCLEYAHAQFLYAIRQLSVDPAVPEPDRKTLRSTYFAGGAAEPNALITPRRETLIGNTADAVGTIGMAGTIGGDMGGGPSHTMSAAMQEGGLITAASLMAKDVNPKKFSNRSESTYRQVWPGREGTVKGEIVNAIFGPLYDEVDLDTFTYRSFIDSRKFFADKTPTS
jgi:hypothetical protein